MNRQPNEMVVSEHFVRCVAEARSDSDELGKLFDGFRPLLLLRARMRINPKLERRCDPVDIVQQALTLAVDRFEQFRGKTPDELHAWLSTIHDNIVRDAVRRHVLADRRSVTREVPLESKSQSLLADDSTPSRRCIRSETKERLRMIIDELPGAQGEVMRLHYLEGRKIWEVAEQMNTSTTAAAGLVKRALHALRLRMNEESWR